jgi:sortase A
MKTLARLFLLLGCACMAAVVHERAVPRASGPRVLATLEIPALHVSLPVVEGTESDSLKEAIGHIPGTAVPGGLGNVGLAGHRDTFFRPLRDISKGMDIALVNRDGSYHYSVVSTEIVMPEAVSVLDISHVPELTLITCYPFDYVGSAPRRFIVHAYLESVSPSNPNVPTVTPALRQTTKK